jgi:hypothetical protein
MSSLLALLLVASPPSWMKLSDAERSAAVASLEPRPLGERLLVASERFKGTPYVFSPLGEGQGKDPDPLIRYDAVDCLTFVETTMALALAPRPEEVEPTLTRIRYRANPVYEERNHLMEADWIPNNIAKGFIADVTRTYGKSDAVTVSKTYTDETWSSKSATDLGLPKDHQAKGTFSLSMIPIKKFVARAAGAPAGTLVVVVRKDQPDLVTRVSHVGMLVHEKGRAFLRHAALGEKEVIDEPLEHFVERHAAFQKWPVEGFALYAVTGTGG